jgi:hypothetical protein
MFGPSFQLYVRPFCSIATRVYDVHIASSRVENLAQVSSFDGSFTLAIFSTISCAISQVLSHLVYLSVSRRPRWPRQVQYVSLSPALSQALSR